jgi:DNA-binding MarR family transcriptional regulator
MSSKDTQLGTVPLCSPRGDQDLVELARSSGLGDEAAQAVAAIDAVMLKIRRGILRRDFGRQVLAKLDPTLEVAHLDVIGAIGHNPVWDTGGVAEEVTVGLIAQRLGIDPSRASRVVADVVDRGYARRICLELTAKGEKFGEAVRQNKWNLFARALGQWNEADLITFANLFERFSNWATDNDGVSRSADEIRKLLADDVPPAKADLADAK